MSIQIKQAADPRLQALVTQLVKSLPQKVTIEQIRKVTK